MLITHTAYAAANMLVGRLEKLGILVEFTGDARNRRYLFDPYVRLFTEDVVGDDKVA